MGRLFVVVTACAAVASAGGAASLSAARGDCKVECKQVHRQLSPDTCRKLGRTVAREARAAASNACLAAFNRGLQDECEETCLAKFGGRGGGHPGPALDRVYDAMGRPCTDRENWDACRRGYEDAVAKTREFFDFDDHKKAPPRQAPAAREPAPEPAYVKRAETKRVENVVTLSYRGETVPIVLREGDTLVEVVNAWCRDHEPDNPACARALRLLAAAAAKRNGGAL